MERHPDSFHVPPASYAIRLVATIATRNALIPTEPQENQSGFECGASSEVQGVREKIFGNGHSARGIFCCQSGRFVHRTSNQPLRRGNRCRYTYGIFAGAFKFGTLELHGALIWRFAVYYAVLFLLTAFFEDFLMRGYSQWVLSRGMNFWPAAALLSFAFGYIHGGNPGEAKTGLVAAGFIGFFLCLTLRRTGDLWWAVGFHMAWDWGESYLYSVPDSGQVLPGHLLNSSLHGPDWLTGGSVGPEGSYLVFVVIGALWVLFDRAYPEVKYGANHARTLSSS